MPLWGLDISNHQGTGFPLQRAASEDFDFGIFKASEGAGFQDSTFTRNLDVGRDASLLCAAYHYQRPDSVADQVAIIRRTVPLDCPVIPDVESGSGSLDLTRQLVDALRTEGYSVPLAYIPNWFWQGHWGSPDLSGLPPLWSSRYASTSGYASQVYQDVPDWYWNGYGGLHTEVLQFTSSATVAGRSPIDANAYRGSRDQLAALLTEEDDMPLSDSDLDDIQLRAYRGVSDVLADIGLPPDVPSHVRDRARHLRGPLGLDDLAHAVAQGNDVSAEDIAAALAPKLSEQLMPTLSDAVREVLGQDNEAQAQAIVDAVAQRLATGEEQPS